MVLVRGSGSHDAEFLIKASNNTKKRLAMTLVLSKIQQEAEIVEMISQQSSEQKRLDDVQQKIVDGLFEEFEVDENLIKFVIGPGGKNINGCKETTGISKVVILPDSGIVRIIGPTKESVKQARDILEFIEKRYPIASSEARQLMQNVGKCLVLPWGGGRG